MDDWSLWQGWDRFAEVATALTIFGLGMLVAEFWHARRENRAEHERLELERQEQAYRTITEQYTHLLELCLDRPYLTFPWMNAGQLETRSDAELTDAEWMQDLLVYELLFETLEKAFILYRADVLYQDPTDQRRFQARPKPSAAELSATDFRSRQWWGWDSWVNHFGEEKLFWDRWESVQDVDTYDDWFMRYMANKQETLSPRAINRGIR